MAETRPVSAAGPVFQAVYGAPGNGKTTFVGTSPAGSLVIRPPTEHMDPILGSGLVEREVEDWEGMNDIDEWLRHDGSQFKGKWVWVDNWSLLQDHLLDDVWNWTIDKFPHRKETPIDRGEYNLNFVREQRWMRDVVRSAKAHGFNFGFTAHTMDLEDPVTGDLKIQPWIQGKNMSQKFQGYMTIVSYLDLTPKGRRIFRFNGTKEYVAKNQYEKYGAFPSGKLLNPTMPKLMAEVDKARKKAIEEAEAMLDRAEARMSKKGRKRPARRRKATR